MMIKALAYQQLLDSGEVKNRAELAHREGVTRPRITQIMKLLRLAPEIQEAILALPAGTPERLVTERKLRQLVDLEPVDQLAAFDAISNGAFRVSAGARKVG